MRLIESIEDQMNGLRTYELSDGRRVRLDAHAVREVGAPSLLRMCGFGDLLPTERLPVIHHGRRVGTMSPDFDPDNIGTKSFLYDPRPGDFRRDGDTWVASRTLGPGDVECVQGFNSDAEERLRLESGHLIDYLVGPAG